MGRPCHSASPTCTMTTQFTKGEGRQGDARAWVLDQGLEPSGSKPKVPREMPDHSADHSAHLLGRSAARPRCLSQLPVWRGPGVPVLPHPLPSRPSPSPPASPLSPSPLPIPSPPLSPLPIPSPLPSPPASPYPMSLVFGNRPCHLEQREAGEVGCFSLEGQGASSQGAYCPSLPEKWIPWGGTQIIPRVRGCWGPGPGPPRPEAGTGFPFQSLAHRLGLGGPSPMCAGPVSAPFSR